MDFVKDATGALITSINAVQTVTGVTATTITFANTGANFATVTQTTAFVNKTGTTCDCATPDDASETLQITLPSDAIQTDMDLRFVGVFSDDEINHQTYLCVIFYASAPATSEVMTVRACRLVSGTTYALKVRRQQFGTAQLNFASGDRAWIIAKSAVEPFSHAIVKNGMLLADWSAYRLSAFTASSSVAPDAILTTSTRSITTNVATLTCYRAHGFYTGQKVLISNMGSTAYNTASPVAITVTSTTAFTYACVAANEGTTADVAGIVDTTHRFYDPWPSTITWLVIQRNGTDMGSGYGTDSSTADVQFISFRIDDGNADILDVRLEARQGSLVSPIYNKSFGGIGRAVTSASFNLALGAWSIYAVVTDMAGRVTEQQLAPVAGGSPVVLSCTVALTCAAPYGSGGSLLCATAGATLYYYLAAGYAAAPPTGAFGGVWTSGWTLYTGGTVNIPYFHYSLHTVATHSGYTTSAVVSYYA